MGMITFGKGIYAVDTGTYDDKPAVYITPQKVAGPVGEKAPPDERGLVRNTLIDGETVLVFPTREQCRAVADAIVGQPLMRGA